MCPKYGEYSGADVAKMQLRSVMLQARFQNFVLSDVDEKYQSCICLSPLKLAFAMGQYLNDLNRLTAFHSVRKPDDDHYTEIGRALGYMLKWIISESPAYTNMSMSDYAKADEVTQQVALRPNIYFIVIVIVYMLGADSLEDLADKHKKTLGGLIYSIKKGDYDQKLASTIFSTFEVKSQ